MEEWAERLTTLLRGRRGAARPRPVRGRRRGQQAVRGVPAPARPPDTEIVPGHAAQQGRRRRCRAPCDPRRLSTQAATAGPGDHRPWASMSRRHASNGGASAGGRRRRSWRWSAYPDNDGECGASAPAWHDALDACASSRCSCAPASGLLRPRHVQRSCPHAWRACRARCPAAGAAGAARRAADPGAPRPPSMPASARPWPGLRRHLAGTSSGPADGTRAVRTAGSRPLLAWPGVFAVVRRGPRGVPPGQADDPADAPVVHPSVSLRACPRAQPVTIDLRRSIEDVDRVAATWLLELVPTPAGHSARLVPGPGCVAGPTPSPGTAG